jgi:hypothetical protein
MKTPPLSECAVAELLTRELGLAFGASKRSLGDWGQADRCVELTADRWVLLEVEGSQHHPNTNVLKVWPFLEEHPSLSITLIHVFSDTGRNRNSTRGRLAQWLAQRMKSHFSSRFEYHRVIVNGAGAAVDLDSLRQHVAAIQAATQ